MRKSLLAVSLAGLVASVGCASASASSSADRPALLVPPPPLRVIEPAPEVPEPVADLPQPGGSPGTPSGAPSRPPRPAPRPEAPKGAETKPDAAKPAEQPPVDPLPPAPASPPAQLRTPQTADTSGAAKAVRTTIDSARGLLNTVNFAQLSNERKKAYNDAKLFMQEAEDALKQENLAFAQAVATKAETLAKELAGR